MPKRDPITVTDAAKSYISSMLTSSPGKALKVSVNTKGCAGHKYEYSLVDLDSIDPRDDQISGDWGSLVLDRSSILYLIGSKLDLAVGSFHVQLTWQNPMATGMCGCGESFSVNTGCRDEEDTNSKALL